MRAAVNVLGIFICIFAEDCFGQNIIYKPNLYRLGGYFVGKSGYSDLRLKRENENGAIYWELRDGSVQVSRVYTQGSLQALKIKTLKENSVNEILYLRSHNKMKLIYAKARPYRVLSNTVLFKSDLIKNELCEGRRDSLIQTTNFISTFNESVLVDNLEKFVIDQSCKSASETEYQRMLSALTSAMKPDNLLISCLRDPGKISAFSNIVGQAGNADIKNEMELLSLKYEMQIAQFSRNPESMKGLVSCKKNKSNIPLAKFHENKGIKFTSLEIEDPKMTPTRDEYIKTAFHESLHMLDVTNESVTEGILALCYGEERSALTFMEAELKKRGMKFSGTGTIFEDISTTQASVQNNTEGVPAKIPRELAENAIPNPSIEEVNQPFIEASEDLQKYLANPDVAANEALTKSAAANAPMLKFANGLMAAFVPSANAVPAGSGLRRPASLGSNGAKTESEDDYFVKEEILLSDKSKGKTEQTTTATKDRQNNSQREVKTPNQARAIDSTSGSVREGAISDSSGSADAGPRGSGTPDRIERSSRGPASTSGATPISIEKKSRSNANASVDRDQIVTFFKDYQQAKRKLRDPKFVDTLKKNNISVLDTAGNVIGDQKGSIVYLDTGTNYVRQK